MSLLDLTEDTERLGQAFMILKRIHKTEKGKNIIHTEKFLTDNDGYDFPCPVCGATVEYDGTVNLPETKTKAQCQGCQKLVNKQSLLEKVLESPVSKDMFAARLCPDCYARNDIMKINHKRKLKAHIGWCNECKMVFDADTVEELQSLVRIHPHPEYTILEDLKDGKLASGFYP